MDAAQPPSEAFSQEARLPKIKLLGGKIFAGWMQRFHLPGRSLHPCPLLGSSWWGGGWPLAGVNVASTLRGLARVACPQKDLKIWKIF